MAYDDLSQAVPEADATTLARADIDSLPPGVAGPAMGNTITGTGTITGQAGADSVGDAPAMIVAVQGAGGGSEGESGTFVVQGQYGVLTIHADGSYTYVRSAGAPDGVDDVFSYTIADQSGHKSASTLTIELGTELPPETQTAALSNIPGVVNLPAGVELSDIHVVGRDLVIDLPDGTHITIPGGAVFVPQLVIGDVEVPPTNLAAVLIDSEPQPAAGPPLSSGGNFAADVPPLDPGVPLGDLIPPTDLAFTPPEFNEVNDFIDHEPTVVIQTPDNPAGAVNAAESVFEKGLAVRGGEPAGSGEISDGNGANNSDTTEANSGTIVYTAEDGLESITINGEVVTAVGQQIAGQFGTMTITAIDSNAGTISYSYVLADNTSGDTTSDVFSVSVTDNDGDVATGSVTVDIVDDVPTARNDADLVDSQTGTAGGNVMTGSGTTSGSQGADTVGADNAQVTGVHSGTSGGFTAVDSDGVTITGTFGDLHINSDGTYSYTLHAGAAGGGTDVFTYQLTDGDGDTSNATLTITNPDKTPSVGTNASVQLDDDALVGGNPGGTGDDANAANTTGTLSGSGGDGALTFSLDASGAPSGFTYQIQSNGELWVLQGSTHVLTVTVNSATGAYSVTQVAPIDHPAGNAENNDIFSIHYTVTDADGDSAPGTLTVNVDDDTPIANNDSDSVDLQTHVATGNVIDGSGTDGGANGPGADSAGADDNGHIVGISGAGGSDTNATGGFVATGEFGTLTMQADGSYSYVLNQNAPGGSTDTFTYSFADGDGDTTTATLTINNPDHTPTIQIETPENPAGAVDASESVFEKGLPARGTEPAGSGEIADGDATNNSDTSETNTGTIVFSSEDGVDNVSVNGDEITSVGQVVHGTYGDITITSIDLATGEIGYSYTLLDNTSGNNTADVFTVSVTDTDGDTAEGSLTVNIVDDSPAAKADTDSVSEDGTLVASGNLISGAGSDGNPAGGDVVGADDAVVTIVDGLNPGVGQVTADADGETLVGQYGTLVIHSDGSYNYTLDNGNPVVQALSDGDTLTEQFDYTLQDGDGDLDNAILTITINGTNDVPTVDVPTAQEAGTLVDEAGLPTRNGEPAGTGEAADGNPTDNDDPSEATTGTITYTDGDGPTTVTIQGANGPVTVAAGVDIAGAYGTLHIDTFDAATHTITYTYTLNDNVDHDSQPGSDSFNVTVSDSDGNPADDASGTLTIDIANDAPIAVADTDSVVEGSSTGGNVLTGVGGDGDPAGADVPGADDFAPNAVVGVTTGDTNTNLTDGSGVGGTGITGSYGTLVLNADGSYTYTATAGLNPPPGATDVFTYTVIDNDGNASNTTLTIDVIDDLMPTIDVPGAQDAGTLVDEAGLPAHDGEPAGTGEIADGDATNNSDSSEITSGTISFTPGDSPATVTINGVAVTAGADFTGDYGTLHIDSYDPNGTITYTYTLTDNVDHDSDLTPFEDFTVTVTDADGDPASDHLIINIDNDAPIAVADTDSVVEGSSTGGNVLTGVGGDGDPAGADVPGADDFAPNAVVGVTTGDTNTNLTDGSGVGGTGITGSYGTLVLNADGSYTYTATAGLNPPPGATDVFTYTVIDNDGNASNTTLTIDVIDDLMPTAGSVDAAVDDEGLAGGIAGGTGDIDADFGETGAGVGDESVFTGTLAGSGGDAPTSFLFEQSLESVHTDTLGTETLSYQVSDNGLTLEAFVDGGTRDGTLLFTIQITNAATGDYTLTLNDNVLHVPGGNETSDTLSVPYQIQDADGDLSGSAGSLNITFNDDMPVAFGTGDVNVEQGGSASGSLDTGDGDITNNYGADGGTVQFAPSLDGVDSGLMSNNAAIIYNVVNDTTLQGVADGTVIFTITLNPTDVADPNNVAGSSYTIDLDGQIDSITNVDFNEDDFDFVGGNNAWAGFVPLGQEDSPVDDNSQDLLITPTNGTSINTSGILGGVDTGQSLGPDEGFRVDYVVDLQGDPSTADYNTPGGANHTFDSHYDTNGASVLFVQSGGTTLNITAFDDNATTGTDGNDAVGDGQIDTITGLVITYKGVESDIITPTSTATPYTVNGSTFNVSLNPDGSVTVTNVNGTSGAGAEGTEIAVFTEDGYNSLQFDYVDGDTIKFGGFSAAVQSSEPVDFHVPVQIVDNDGDVVAGDDLDITVYAVGDLPNTISTLSANDSTDSLHTSLLATNDNSTIDTQKGQQSYSNNTLLVGAIAAAGLESQAVAGDGGHDQLTSGHDSSIDGGTVHTEAFAPTALDSSTDTNAQSLLTTESTDSNVQQSDGGHSSQSQAGDHTSVDSAAPAQAPTELVQPTDTPSHGDPAPASAVTAAAVAMPSAEQLASVANGGSDNAAGVAGNNQSEVQGTQHDQVVGKVLADSLAGGNGHESPIDAALSNLPSHAGPNAGLEALASHGEANVPAWHNAGVAAYTSAHNVFSMETVMLHHDAVPPAAHSG